MQLVLVCGGKGTRLRSRRAGPKSLVPLGGTSLLARLTGALAGVHTSARPPIVIVDANDRETPAAIASLMPSATLVRQAQPDGVANALLVAEPLLDNMVCVVLGDVFVHGAIVPMPHTPALFVWRDASPVETRKNFGVSFDAAGVVRSVIEKPTDCDGLACGMGVYVFSHAMIADFARAPIDAATGERGITMAIQSAIVAGHSLDAVQFSGHYVNVNSPADVEAVERYLFQPVW
jgi:dTDP-glucose pyrophosphorylase